MEETLVLSITPTGETTWIDGVQCRLWNGATPDGTRCGVFVARIGVPNGPNCETFARALREMPRPVGDAENAMTRAGVNTPEVLRAAMHALRSYQYGNGSLDLAREIADQIEVVLGETRS